MATLWELLTGAGNDTRQYGAQQLAAQQQTRYYKDCLAGNRLTNLYAPGGRKIHQPGDFVEVDSPSDIVSMRCLGQPTRVLTCTHCGRQYDKRPVNSCIGCAGGEFEYR